MNVNLKNNRFITIIAIAYILLSAFSFFTKNFESHDVVEIEINKIEHLPLDFFLKILNILLLVYLISILISFGEKTHTLILALKINICIVAYTILEHFLPHSIVFNFNGVYSISERVLITVFYLYLIFQAFNVESISIRFPFKLFGLSVFIFMLAPFIVTIGFQLVAPGYLTIQLFSYSSLASLLTPISIVFIIKRVGDFIKNSEDPAGSFKN